MPDSHESAPVLEMTEDEKQLAKLGYSQDLNRSWSGFSNFAISFSIISILAGCFTSFALGWNNGGPAAIAWGWPILTVFILIIGMCMSELVSAYPTSGGIYWWASKLGGPAAGFYTGWLNLIGLVAIVASVAYGCATFLDATLGYFSSSWAKHYSLTRVFIEFVVILALAAVVNIFSSHLLAVLNNISVWWHVAGAAIIVLILWLFLKNGAGHASIGDVFGGTVNNTGLFGGKTHGMGFFLYILPLSGILTQYTITGYDASAHLSEETQAASTGAAKGIWRSIFYSGVGGWILLLSFLFAVQSKDGVTAAGGSIFAIFGQALTPHVAGLVVAISAIGQFFCTVACMTSTSRMFFAFSRDGAMPGAKHFAKLNANRVPANAVMASAIIALILTLPALIKVDIAGAPVPVAFFAVVSIGVIGLYLAFAIPIFLRWRHGSRFEVGAWTNGAKYKWMNPIAVVEIIIMSIVGLLPTSSVGIWWNTGFAWKYVNYAIIVVPVALILLTIYWFVSVRHWFTGPKHTIDPDVVAAFDERIS
jgi:amino acid transporter